MAHVYSLALWKTWVFMLFRLHCQKNYHNIDRVLSWHEKRMRFKNKPESHTCVLVSGAHVRLLIYLWPYMCSAHYVAGCGRVIPLKVTYHVTKNPNNFSPARLERAFTLAKNQWNFGGVSKNHAAEVGFSIRVLKNIGVFRGSCLATFNEKPECEKDSGFFYASVNGTHDVCCLMYLFFPLWALWIKVFHFFFLLLLVMYVSDGAPTTPYGRWGEVLNAWWQSLSFFLGGGGFRVQNQACNTYICTKQITIAKTF